MKMKEYMTESNWTKGQLARNKDGFGCSLYDTKAEKFCLMGATRKCYPNETEKIQALLEQELRGYAVTWNDEPGRTFAEVKAVIEKLDI